MKTLNEYIIENELEENILNRLYFHTCIEFKLDHNLYPYIVESLGKFDNVGKVVKHIIDTLKTNFESQVIDCTNDGGTCRHVEFHMRHLPRMVDGSGIRIRTQLVQHSHAAVLELP